MLTGPPFIATCDKCGDARGLEAARLELARRGWLEAAQRGKVRERWQWWCPACAPKGSTSFGRSTGEMRKP